MFMDNYNIIHETDVENWGPFLQPIIVETINSEFYQCNNPIYLVPITETIKELYRPKDKSKLEKYLDLYLKENQINLEIGSYFVKLSTVSGKDTIDTEEFIGWDSNNIAIRKLIIKSVAQLSAYLLESERIAEHIANSTYLVFREWIDFKSEEEFRCFIYQRKLVAISQYDYIADLPVDMQQPYLIIKTIGNFVNQVIGLIPFENTILDVAVRFSDLRVYFIEFNSFGINSDTDAGLYDWVHDDHILCPPIFNEINIRLFSEEYIERKFQV